MRKSFYRETVAFDYAAVKATLKNAGYKLCDVSINLGRNKSYLAYSGKTGRISRRTLVDLCRMLNVPTAKFATIDDEITEAEQVLMDKEKVIVELNEKFLTLSTQQEQLAIKVDAIEKEIMRQATAASTANEKGFFATRRRRKASKRKATLA